MAKDVAAAPKSALPAHLQGGKQNKFGNTDRTDMIIPRVKLLQAISPEVEEQDAAKAGQFWHTIAAENLGPTLRGVPIICRKSYVLWSPRGDDRGVLARANDGIHWDNADMEFTVKPKNSPNPVTYKLGKTVHDKIGDTPALSEFGSSIPGDKNSPPAAALTYQLLWYFPDHPELSPAIIINTRSGVKPAKGLISRVDMMPVDSYGQLYDIGVNKVPFEDGYFYNYKYTAAGYADEALYAVTKAMYDTFATGDWKANDESEDPEVGNGDAAPRPKGKTDSKDF
jgi:hypothetical protein